MEEEEKYLSVIVKPLLSNEGAMHIERKIDERGVCLLLDVDRADMGRIIGKEGQTAQAIRTLLRQFGGVSKKMISLVINEPAGSERKSRYHPLHELRDKEILGV